MKAFVALKTLAASLGLVAGLLVSTSALAAGGMEGFHVGLSALKYDTTYESSGTTSKDNRTFLDFKVGYLTSSQIYFGGIYSSYSQNTDTNSPARTATGLSIGYHNQGFFADFNYFLMSEYQSGATTTWKDGSGFGLDFGYNVMMSSNFYVGAELTYKTLEYKKINVGGADVSATNKVTEMLPLLNLGFYF